MNLKPVVFMRRTRRSIKRFPLEARKDVGWQLRAVQAGEDPADWKPMSTVGAGAKEIRIHGLSEYRILYVAHFPEAIYVLHAFGKSSQRTPQRDIQLARDAYAEIQTLRQARE